MDTFETIKTMLAVRSYRKEQIPSHVVTRIVEAGRLTGSSMNTQQWDFIIIQDPETLKKLGQLASTGSYLANAALAIAVVVPDSPTGYIDGTRAAQDMMLAAWGEGIGSNWIGNVNTAPIKQLLNVASDRLVLTIMAFGYPAQQLGRGRKKRKALAEIAHTEKLGQAYRPT
jgi:nitroreductase